MNSSTAASTMKATRKRRRPALSCQECRRRKIKCDRKNPCAHCVLSKRPCGYDIGVAKAGTPDRESTLPTDLVAPYATPQTSENSPMSGVSTSQQSRSGFASDSKPHCQVDASDEREVPSASFPSSVSATDCELQKLKQRVRTLEQLLVERSPSTHPPKSSEAKDTPPEDRRLALSKSRLYGLTHWSNACHELTKISIFLRSPCGNSADDAATRQWTAEIQALLTKCKLLAKSTKATRPSRCSPVAEPSLMTLSKNFVDWMVHLYISHFESVFRILHVPSFWRECDRYCSSPAEVAPVIQLKIQLVVAIGSSLHRDAQDVDLSRRGIRQWVPGAQQWVSGPIEKDRLSIDGLQVQCLLILARQVLGIGGDTIWIAIGTLVRTAVQLGLHRDPKHFAKMTILQSEIRRRLWATIMEMNVHASLDAGMPPSISLEDFDTHPPSNMNDEDIDDSTEYSKKHPTTAVTDSTLQRFLFECLQPRLETLRRMNGISSEMSQNQVIALTSLLSNACRQLNTHVKKGEEVNFRHSLADLFIRRFLLTLHRTLVSRASTNPLFYFSRKVSVDSAMTLLSPPAPDERFSHLVLVGGGIFKHRLIPVSVALASELLIDIDEHGTQGTFSYRQMLVDAVKEALRQSAERIKLGDTNVRLHMKLRIVLARAECTETGSLLKLRMAQSAKDSLEWSHSIIQANSSPHDAGLQADEHSLVIQQIDQDDFTMDLNFDDILQTSGFGIDEMFGFGLQ